MLHATLIATSRMSRESAGNSWIAWDGHQRHVLQGSLDTDTADLDRTSEQAGEPVGICIDCHSSGSQTWHLQRVTISVLGNANGLPSSESRADNLF